METEGRHHRNQFRYVVGWPSLVLLDVDPRLLGALGLAPVAHEYVGHAAPAVLAGAPPSEWQLIAEVAATRRPVLVRRPLTLTPGQLAGRQAEILFVPRVSQSGETRAVVVLLAVEDGDGAANVVDVEAFTADLQAAFLDDLRRIVARHDGPPRSDPSGG